MAATSAAGGQRVLCGFHAQLGRCHVLLHVVSIFKRTIVGAARAWPAPVRTMLTVTFHQRQVLSFGLEGLEAVACGSPCILPETRVVVARVQADSALRIVVVALGQVLVASVVFVTATSAHFVGLAGSVLVPAQQSLLLVLLASRDLG